MNERFRELAKHAGITTNLDTDYFEQDMNKWVDYFSEKFAQLIVAECVDAIMTRDRQAFLDRREYFAAVVLNHFDMSEAGSDLLDAYLASEEK